MENSSFREATLDDIPHLHAVRTAVKENVLSDPSLVTEKEYASFLTERGRGWVCEVNGVIAGFAIIDLRDENVWALFLLPQWEGKGIGRELHRVMLNWYFSQGKEKVWLGTSPHTRAEGFYRKMGWREAGMHGKEIRFEMTGNEWLNRNTAGEMPWH
jgi:GNAT superfamily N-acetyltransferase